MFLNINENHLATKLTIKVLLIAFDEFGKNGTEFYKNFGRFLKKNPTRFATSNFHFRSVILALAKVLNPTHQNFLKTLSTAVMTWKNLLKCLKKARVCIILE